ncbi:hypothetical protein [Fibrella forsythiae]|uniref:Lipoprotein n=1 Tax=Fibrella forsythiae TaxID=2817061 RepID=A0ABS3JSU2_9BACT|nr:hypothetical protein [Fibrella forsythiae]MBO0953097.1 hypothetical protein [Fibrella forsythiae]
MKSVLLLSLGILLLSDGCKQDLAPACPNAGALAGQATQLLGTVYYDRARGSYGIQVATSMDSADMGLTCNLPAEYQKELTKVRFSGTYYADEQSTGGPVGYRYYYLSISSIATP